jgi:hypothetical protein
MRLHVILCFISNYALIVYEAQKAFFSLKTNLNYEIVIYYDVSRVEVGSNTSTVALRLAGGD